MIKEYINIVNARENNLKNVSVKIPKKEIIIFTGVSGSGKSSLCIDTIAAESGRELNETFPSFVQQYLPKYGRPDVEKIENLPVTIIIDQKKPNSNSRSTVGTYTDIYPFLRLLFSRVGEPFVGYSDVFSYNHPVGKCERCDGLGIVNDLDIHKLVDFEKCLNDEGVINYPAFTTGAWRWKRYAFSGLFDLDKKIKDYDEKEMELFLYSPQIKLKNPPSNWPKSAKFEGIYPRMYRSIINTKEGKLHAKTLEKMVTEKSCDKCGGTRLNDKIRSCKINGKNFTDVADMPIPEAVEFIKSIEHPLAIDIKKELVKRLNALIEIGLGYITLSRGTSTLSGGEAQRTKIAKYINSALSDIVYVLDEPSAGLHNKDIDNLKKSLKRLKNQGNTILIIEHNKEIIKLADHIVDMGPLAGTGGGNVVFEGTYDELLSSDTITGKMLNTSSNIKKEVREPNKFFEIRDANLHNLKYVNANMPLDVLTVVVGVAGAGKSSLIECFINQYNKETIYIRQKDIGVNMRSTPVTYLDIADNIRDLFAKENKISKSFFSFNSKGACPSCKGKGVIITEMSFMESIETICHICDGKRYNDEILAYRYKGKNIAEVMDFTVEEAICFFKDEKFVNKLESLEKVGLSYLNLNQSMSTLSGGELQRIKLATFLSKKGEVFIIDEPTNGLHLNDTKKLMDLFNNMVDQGNTVILVEHNIEVIKNSDYVIELGEGGGIHGGKLLFSGPPSEMTSCEKSITKEYL